MPACFVCKGPTPPEELKPFGKNNRGWPEEELGCSACRRRRLTQAVSQFPVKGKTEVTMSKERKPIISFNVYQVGEGEEEDYEIQASVRKGGLTLEFDSTVSKIRQFFTERREREEQKLLDAAKKDVEKGKRDRKGLRSVPEK